MARNPSSTFKLPMRVWDLPVRLFHWLLAATMLTSYLSVTFATGEYSASLMKLHFYSGETALALLIYRLIWGVIGSDTARFANFLRSPAAAIAHLAKLRERSDDNEIGHNAAGGWMVVFMLALLGVQVGTGLFSNDDGSSLGPLAHLVSDSASDTLSLVHSVNFNFLAAAVALHLIAIALYARLKGQNLVLPMLTGKKRLPAAIPAPRMAHPLLAVLTLLIAVGVTLIIIRL